MGAGVAVSTLTGGDHPAVADQAGQGAVAKSASSTGPGTQTAPGGGAHTVPAAAILTTVTSPDSYISQPAGAKAPTSSAAVLAELLKLLPPGTTSHYAFDGLGAWLDLEAGGLGCERCYGVRGDAHALTADDVVNFRALAAERGTGAVLHGTVRVTRAVDELITWHLGRRPKSRALMHEFS